VYSRQPNRLILVKIDVYVLTGFSLAILRRLRVRVLADLRARDKDADVDGKEHSKLTSKSQEIARKVRPGYSSEGSELSLERQTGPLRIAL
jgi:hypothetical protein